MAVVLKCQDDLDFRKAQNDDENDLNQLLWETLSSAGSRDAVLELRGDEAKQFLDLTYLVRDLDICFV
jgi:hypothetical protein